MSATKVQTDSVEFDARILLGALIAVKGGDFSARLPNEWTGAPLANRVHNLIYDSLAPNGLLVLGSKESLNFTAHEKEYLALDEREKIYRKIR